MAGRQFAEHDPLSITTHINVSRDKYMNEIPTDQPKHDNTTPAEGSWNFSGGQYDDSPGRGGYGSYGTEVADKGKNPGAERTTVNAGRYPTDRGKEN